MLIFLCSSPFTGVISLFFALSLALGPCICCAVVGAIRSLEVDIVLHGCAILLLVTGLVDLAPYTEFVLFSMLFDSDNDLLVLGEESSL